MVGDTTRMLSGDLLGARHAASVELHASRQDDPNQWFLVDISNGIVDYFDESEMDVDFTNFLFYCPTMDAPMPLEVVAPELLEDRPEVWSVRFAETSDDLRFRLGCRWVCIGGQHDCYERCPEDLLPKKPDPAPPIPSL